MDVSGCLKNHHLFGPPEISGLVPDSPAFLRKILDKMQVQLDSEEVPSSQDAWEVPPIDAFRVFLRGKRKE